MKLLSVIVVLVLLAPVLTSCKKLVQPKDCSDIHHQVKTRRSGVYTIYPLGKTSAVQVFQRRMDGTLNFYRPWHQYKMGFGRAAGEYWLGDSMKVHNKMKFSTFDKDQDTWSDNCARRFLGAFWYQSCHHANPNGVYLWGAENKHHAMGVLWYHYKGHNYSLKSISMKIRPVK
ncbi:Microfibril-associated glycoprotein 4 Precursor [Larimichthys crocea]|uniref:Microfibril-associated glycoprotein 4 n=1 Tax=Larimichthys crocea TaxID=215358 RepID=A0A6G0HX48_LARCR|nr:Microfibril-associated glycoprotein 4 Precursor [Larimichthys crocea]